MTPYGHAGTQYPQPLHTSSCTTTVPNSVRTNAPVGQTSRQAACVQCLQTSEDISQRKSRSGAADESLPGGRPPGMPRSTTCARARCRPASWWPTGSFCSMNATCRQVLAPSAPVLS